MFLIRTFGQQTVSRDRESIGNNNFTSTAEGATALTLTGRMAAVQVVSLNRWDMRLAKDLHGTAGA